MEYLAGEEAVEGIRRGTLHPEDGQQQEQDCHHPHGGPSETEKLLAETSLVERFRIQGYLQTSEVKKAEGVKMYTQ